MLAIRLGSHGFGTMASLYGIYSNTSDASIEKRDPGSRPG
jgi:hypothetical protein